MEHVGGEAAQRRFFPVLLAPMCLNRYYVAEGVRLYAQESWARVMGTSGRQRVAEHVDQVPLRGYSAADALPCLR